MHASKALDWTAERGPRELFVRAAIEPADTGPDDRIIEGALALHRIGPRDRGLNHACARLLLAATRGELDDHRFTTASNSEQVALKSLLKQGVLIAIAGQTQIIPGPDAIYDLDPTLSAPPRVGQLLSVDRPPEDRPVR